MDAYKDAITLVDHASDELTKIRTAYEQALLAQSVSPALLIAIKNLCENLRSALDFVSVSVHEKHCSNGVAKSNIGFPYAKVTTSEKEFREFLTKRFVGLSASRIDLFEGLINVQHFGSKGFTWLPTFIELNNESKHQRLIPQVRREQRELHILNGSTGIVLEQGAAIVLDSGASVNVGGALIHGGQTVSTDNIPSMQGGKAEIIAWISFHFESNDQPVIPLLLMATAGVREIVEILGK